MFNVLWTILLGIIGGIISSVIVSRVFMIQDEHRQQLKFVEGIMRKLGMIKGYLAACKVVFEVSYDEDIRIENEMKEKGYKSEMEYYSAHREKRWISTDDLLGKFKSEILRIVDTLKTDVFNSNVEDKDLSDLMHLVMEYLHDISAIKELNFLSINQFEESEKKIINLFDDYKRISGKRFVKLVLEDKIMISLYILLGIIIISTCLTYFFGL